MVASTYRGKEKGEEIASTPWIDASLTWECYKMAAGFIARYIIGSKGLEKIVFGFEEHGGETHL